MGLDSIEILMKVEKTFGIEVPDKDAEKIFTIGDFHDAVWKQPAVKHSNKCKSQVLFYKLRQSSHETFNFPKRDFKTDTPLNDIFPKDNRRQLYLDFAQCNNLEFPVLALEKPWSMALSYFGIITILGGLMLSLILINFFAYTNWTLIIPLAGIAFTEVFSRLLVNKRTVIIPQIMHDFIEKVLTLNYATLTIKNGSNKKEVASVINYIISDMTGLDMAEITTEKKIGDDLGIN